MNPSEESIDRKYQTYITGLVTADWMEIGNIGGEKKEIWFGDGTIITQVPGGVADRIVDCLNACEGIENPGLIIEQALSVVKIIAVDGFCENVDIRTNTSMYDNPEDCDCVYCQAQRVLEKLNESV